MKQAIVCQRNGEMHRADSVVRVQKCDCFFEHACEDLHEKVDTIPAACFSLTFLKVLLSNLTNRVADLLETEDLSGQLFRSVKFSSKTELQPYPIFNTLADSFEISSLKVTAPNNLVTCHAIGIDRVFRSNFLSLVILTIDH